MNEGVPAQPLNLAPPSIVSEAGEIVQSREPRDRQGLARFNAARRTEGI